MSDKLRESALEYHRLPTPGKLAIVATKPLANQRDLSLAYSPGVAEPCLEIEAGLWPCNVTQDSLLELPDLLLFCRGKVIHMAESVARRMRMLSLNFCLGKFGT